MGFWKSQVIQKSQVTHLQLVTFVSLSKVHTHISELTVLALLKNTKKKKETTNERRYPFSKLNKSQCATRLCCQLLQNYQSKFAYGLEKNRSYLAQNSCLAILPFVRYR